MYYFIYYCSKVILKAVLHLNRFLNRSYNRCYNIFPSSKSSDQNKIGNRYRWEAEIGMLLLGGKDLPAACVMTWRFRSNNNQELVTRLRQENVIRSDKVAFVMTNVDRGKYASMNPYEDAPQSIGYNVTISAPHMHATALELLQSKLVPGARALDVGSGSGYLTACMGLLVSPNGLAVGIDHIREIVQESIANIMSDHPELVENGIVKMVVGDGRLGYSDLAPFEAIHVGAASSGLPMSLVDQLAPGGRLVVPIGPPGGAQKLEVIDKDAIGQMSRRSLMMVSYVPLTDRNAQWPGRWVM